MKIIWWKHCRLHWLCPKNCDQHLLGRPLAFKSAAQANADAEKFKDML